MDDQAVGGERFNDVFEHSVATESFEFWFAEGAFGANTAWVHDAEIVIRGTAQGVFRPSVADAGLGELQRQLTYKARWRGRHVIKLDRFDASTQTCSGCGHPLTDDAKLGLSDRRWTCPSCGGTHDRDDNASLNILRWGLDKLIRRGTSGVTPGESVSAGRRPEPQRQTRHGQGAAANPGSANREC
ncbi:RNA-guided endonuclease InsQ/TnpB family protein [Rhodovibrio sodomensis]|uniref:RNA-guided endonuclease InsQ/TnpB family protein n=1 Tax=Rhodovibrio sodomensis TaxID=1088 RepID=UPI001905C94F|nr:zinc ribbon domain-containing protein [Rhodovibrio sodomensis]